MTSLTNYANLRSFNYTPGDEVVFVQGYSTIGDGGEGDFYWDAASTLPDNDGTIIQVTTPTPITTGRWIRVYDGELYVGWFGAIGNSTTDDYASIQATINYSLTLGNAVVAFKQGRTYKIDTGLIVDMNCTSITGNGAIVDYKGLTGAAFTIANSAGPYQKYKNTFGGLVINGISKTNTDIIGMYFNTNSGDDGGSAACIVRNICISSFGTGVKFGNQAYNNNFYDSQIFSCSVGVTNDNGSEGSFNSGERFSFCGCTIFNSYLGVRAVSGNAAFEFNQCSIDYNDKQIEIDGGKVNLINCHCEGRNFTSIPITVQGNGGSFFMSGGWFLVSSGTPPNYIISTINDEEQVSFASFDNVFINGTNTTSNYFGLGSNILIKTTKSFLQTDNPFISSVEMNLLPDGGFEQTTLPDNIFITADTAPITSPTTGTNININISTSQHRNGLQSLEATKTFGPGSPSQFTIVQPIAIGSRPGMEGYVKCPLSLGNIYIVYGYASLTYKNGIYSIFRAGGLGSETINTGAANNWLRFASGAIGNGIPAWATHFIAQFGLQDINPGSVYFDDLVITTM